MFRKRYQIVTQLREPEVRDFPGETVAQACTALTECLRLTQNLVQKLGVVHNRYYESEKTLLRGS